MKLKQQPEDFYVKEINDVKVRKKGDHCYLLIKKKNWTTTHLIDTLANRLRTDPARFQYAGLKDKDAVTEQIISGYKIDTEFLKHIKIKDVEISILGFSDEPMKLGSHQGNEFSIVVRDLDHALNTENLQIQNYFDDQRFGGSIRAVSHLIGEAIVQENYEEAVKRCLCNPFSNESVENKKYREKIEQLWPDLTKITPPKNLFEEQKIIKSLQEEPENYQRAIASLSKRMVMLYIHAYQSYLFNMRLAEYIEQQEKYTYVEYVLGKLPISLQTIKEKTLPLIGMEILSLPQYTVKTIQRPAVITVKKYAITAPEEDELNKGKLKQTVKFSLPNGSYATIAIKSWYARSLA